MGKLRHDYAWEEILVVVKAYPNPSTKYIESSCTAGITRDGEWLRLYPLPYRMLKSDSQFKKYQWIKAKIKKSSDPRPESHYIDIDSIQITGSLSTRDNWAARMDFLDPFLLRSVEDMWDAHEKRGISLAFFRPKLITSLIIEPDSPQWTERQLATLCQQSFFDNCDNRTLEKVPFSFSYRLFCDDPRCNGHKMKIVDWEIYQSYRRWSRQYGPDWEKKLRQRYEYEMQEKNHTHLFLGTMKQHPTSWIVIGLCYPKKLAGRQMPLPL